MTNLEPLKELNLFNFFDLEKLEMNDFSIVNADLQQGSMIVLEKHSTVKTGMWERISFNKELKNFSASLFLTDEHIQRIESAATVAECLEFFRLKYAELNFIELDKKYDEVKSFFDQYKAAKEELIAVAGYGHFFTDQDKTVYKTIDPPGKYTYFEKAAVARTSRRLSDDEESKGSYVLTQKEATEAGFELPEKPKKPKAKKDQDFSGEF